MFNVWDRYYLLIIYGSISSLDITSQSRPTLTLSTSSPKNLSVRIELRRVHDFYLEVNKVWTRDPPQFCCGTEPEVTRSDVLFQEVNFSVTPSTPNYYYFSFDRDPLNLTHGQHSLRFPRYGICDAVVRWLKVNINTCHNTWAHIKA